MKQLSFLSAASHLWLQWIMLGSILVDTFMLYPNIFHNIPESFELGLEFMAVASPPLGAASIITGILALIFAWKVRPARYWILFSMLMIVLEGAASMIFEWPRNTIMFIEGTEVHSVAFLKQTANEFLMVHGFRVACNIVGALLMFVGFMKYYKHTMFTK
ncbi:hypothetical protein [Gracilibacillus salinarum]|uniref:DUF1772 domain-containing protein n=1 Tax=Gracilibacillus salinarum TaxID=2932255 RepID=A0ABY4GKP4_9BACI|nr:hypothetical protein [Gracilibacillus salinarum]UOQ84741.1 hypothetical protein MUN87_19120 [Gracilibacillus salinarum]